MSEALTHRLTIKPAGHEELERVENLFRAYPYKDFQLRRLALPKPAMARFLRDSLKGPGLQSAALNEDHQLVGMISAKQLPWLSKLLKARLFSVKHLLTLDKGPGYYQSMLRYVIDQMSGIDFLDCRVASDDINAIQALENTGFRFVGNETYLVKHLEPGEFSDAGNLAGCGPCPADQQEQVLSLVRETQFHNRYMYDPEISIRDAARIYRAYLAGHAFGPESRSRIMLHRGRVTGFLFYKINQALSRLGAGRYASLDFIGVRKQTQGRGVGEALNRAALADLAQSGISHVVVRTFASNYPAIRICQKVDFQITSSDLHFHLWLRPRVKSEHTLHSSGQPYVSPEAFG